jgi:predicted nucleic-acid-binding Zn-ribbon protein
MSQAAKCPKCGAPRATLGTMLVVCKDPALRKHLPPGLAEISPPGQTEWPLEVLRCPQCGHLEMNDPSFDIPEPLG